MTDSSLNCSIIINGLSLSVNIGVTDNERSIAQKIIIDLKIYFEKMPRGCISNDINDTLCYKNICDLIIENSQKKYNLIEHFGYCLFNQVKNIIPTEHKMMLKVKKFPPIDGLDNGVEFEINNL